MITLTDKIALVTGAGSGIGAAIAECFAEAGALVFASDRDEAAAQQTAARISQAGHRAESLVLDVSDESSCLAAVRTVTEKCGRCDVLVNNAGNFHAGYFEDISPEAFRAQMETNFFGPLNVTRAVLPVMRAGALAVIVPKDKSATLTPVVRKVACGAAEVIPLVAVMSVLVTLAGGVGFPRPVILIPAGFTSSTVV